MKLKRDKSSVMDIWKEWMKTYKARKNWGKYRLSRNREVQKYIQSTDKKINVFYTIVRETIGIKWPVEIKKLKEFWSSINE